MLLMCFLKFLSGLVKNDECKNLMLLTLTGLEPIFEAKINYYIKYLKKSKKMRLNFNKSSVYPMWNDVRTYQTISSEAEERKLICTAIAHFKKKEKHK